MISCDSLDRKETIVDAITERVVDAKSSTTYSRVVGLTERRLDSSVNVRYLFSASELEGGKKRATDPNRSLRVIRLIRSHNRGRT